jgi:hypothetical protein
VENREAVKTRGLRDSEYLAWVRRLPCVVHDPGVVLDPWRSLEPIPVSDPDHLPVMGLKAVGIKSPDAFVIPLCRECHNLRARWLRRPDDIVTDQEAIAKKIPIRFVGWNPYETVARLLWAYMNPPEGMEGWAV